MPAVKLPDSWKNRALPVCAPIVLVLECARRRAPARGHASNPPMASKLNSYKVQSVKRVLFGCLISCALSLPLIGGGQSRKTVAAREEMRGLWVARWSLKSPAAVHNIVAAAKRTHINTLFVQVRGRGDAWYHTDLEPRAEALSDSPP